MVDIKKLTQEKILLFDGAMGTMFQKKGLMPGQLPELLNLTNPELVTEIHREYVLAGADVITANTFQAHELKLGNTATVEAAVTAAVNCARMAGARFVALDVGPLGQLMEPLGTISFERAYEIYKRQIVAGVNAGVDIILIETISDLLEAKAAILAAKESCELPVICTMTFQEDARTFIGCDAVTATTVLQGLGVHALGVNCSLGPKSLAGVVSAMLRHSRVPVIAQANAGIPAVGEDGLPVYELDAKAYAEQVMELVTAGVSIIGGCCGTTPEHIRQLREKTRNLRPAQNTPERLSICASGTRAVTLDGASTLIGERLNPTGKKKLQNALRQGDFATITGEAIAQIQAGARVLDVNVGLPELNEPELLARVVRAVQGVTDAPLQIDSSDPAAIEAAARIYNGKPIINSVNGKAETMNAVFPIAKKYGALVIGLTLDENGIPPTAAGRLEIARRIRDRAREFGLPDEDLLIDCLVLTASAQQEQVRETLAAIRLVKAELGLKTVLGVSNVSFGLPEREKINAAFLAAALGAGLDAAIMNPLSAPGREALDAYRVLSGEDKNAAAFVAKYSQDAPKAPAAPETSLTLGEMIEQGRREQAKARVAELLKSVPPAEIIDGEFVPALNRAGRRFEAGEIFLPQLMMSAQTVQGGFELIRGHMREGSAARENKGRILLATVHGDIHDIGKNIVRMMLENHGYEVIDLGKDVPPEEVAAAIRKHDIRLAGLSALMTTTVKAMKETIAAVRREKLPCAFFVGGAVLNEDYARYVGADFYARDAIEGVNIANRFFGN